MKDSPTVFNWAIIAKEITKWRYKQGYGYMGFLTRLYKRIRGV